MAKCPNLRKNVKLAHFFCIDEKKRRFLKNHFRKLPHAHRDRQFARAGTFPATQQNFFGSAYARRVEFSRESMGRHYELCAHLNCSYLFSSATILPFIQNIFQSEQPFLSRCSTQLYFPAIK